MKRETLDRFLNTFIYICFKLNFSALPSNVHVLNNIKLINAENKDCALVYNKRLQL